MELPDKMTFEYKGSDSFEDIKTLYFTSSESDLKGYIATLKQTLNNDISLTIESLKESYSSLVINGICELSNQTYRVLKRRNGERLFVNRVK